MAGGAGNCRRNTAGQESGETDCMGPFLSALWSPLSSFTSSRRHTCSRGLLTVLTAIGTIHETQSRIFLRLELHQI